MTGGGGKGCGDVVLLLCCCKAWRGHNLASTDHWHWPGRHGAHTYWWFAAQTHMWKQEKRRIFSSMINDYSRRYIFARKDWLYDVLKTVWLLAGIRTSVARLQQVRCAACSAAVLQCCRQWRVWCEYFETQTLLQPHSRTRGHATYTSTLLWWGKYSAKTQNHGLKRWNGDGQNYEAGIFSHYVTKSKSLGSAYSPVCHRSRTAVVEIWRVQSRKWHGWIMNIHLLAPGAWPPRDQRKVRASRGQSSSVPASQPPAVGAR